MNILDSKESTPNTCQMGLKGVGLSTQRKLKDSFIAIVGAGALGTIASALLAKAGVGTLKVIDFDIVEDVNLSAQLMHWDNDVGQKKIISLSEKLSQMNPYIKIETIDKRLDDDNAEEILKDTDLIIDATDNLIARRIINNTCVKLGIPFVHAGIRGFYGQVMVVVPGVTPCLSCIIPEMDQGSRGCPVLIPMVSILASIQALEAIKILGEIGNPTFGYLILVDGLSMDIEKIEVKRNPNCRVCKNAKLSREIKLRAIKGVCPV